MLSWPSSHCIWVWIQQHKCDVTTKGPDWNTKVTDALKLRLLDFEMTCPRRNNTNQAAISFHHCVFWPVTCERGRLSHSAVLVLCGDDARSGTEGRRGQQRQLFHDAAAARVVLRQLIEALFQGISQEVKLLTGLIKTSLGLKIERKRGRQFRGSKEIV